MNQKWDKYFYDLCNIIANNSPCLSKQRGAIVTRGKRIVSTGYNGPGAGVPHCGKDRTKKEVTLYHLLRRQDLEPVQGNDTMCPRHRMGYAAGDGLAMCISAHAEANCIANAASLGVSTENTTMYMNFGIPCKDCLTLMINAGIKKIVVTDPEDFYDTRSRFILEYSGIEVRPYTNGIVSISSYAPYSYPSEDVPEHSDPQTENDP